ncbi:ABC transporter permease [Vineibacter terrae]|uniref:ABC transporter permease n=1 Tax=Vineibacter terrae TaxID=2586908 RepID=A0A5C8PNB8_9HYPH|nr:ABC transporter permease [Vineibacter terrae]TXL76036.1 ABC transporter permease [Vineibacter terrae]
MRAKVSTVLAFLAAPKLWLIIFFILPMMTMVLYSFWRVADYQIVADFTLRNYQKIGGNLYVNVFLSTIRLSLYVTALSLLIGYPVAYFLARKVRRFRLTLLLLVILPLWTSYLVRTYAWMLILGTQGVVNQALMSLGLIDAPFTALLYSDVAVTIALVHIYMPYLILPLYAVLEKIDPSVLEAAWDLGGGRLRTFLSVILPLSLPGIASGCLFVFIPSMGAFVTPELLGGTRSIMIGSIIAQQFGVAYEYPFGSAMALVLMGLIFAAAAATLRYGRPRGTA